MVAGVPPVTQWSDELGAPDHETRPIFVGGCSRSGTTLLAAMLGSSPDVVTVPEAEFKWDVLKDGTTFDGRVQLGSMVDFLSQDPKFAYWGVPLPSLMPAERRQLISLGSLLSLLAAAYARSVDKPAATVWVDHTPANIRHICTLADVCPDARFVHIVRDGRAVAASVMPLDFGPNTPAEAADYWSSQVAMGLAAADRLGDDRVATVRFEDLLQRPREALTALCGRLDLTFHENMIHQRDYRVQSYTAKQHALVSQPPDPRRAVAWRTALSSRQVEIFEARTGELLRYLDYPMEFGISARDLRKAEHIASATRSAVRRVATDRLRRYVRRRRPVGADASIVGNNGNRATA